MNFIYSAIGDNTPENREHLEKLGYEIVQRELDRPILRTGYPQDDRALTYYDYHLPYFRSYAPQIVDCIGNPALFQAVTAMRDDSDYMQWFVSNNKIPGNYIPIPGFNGAPTIDMDKWWHDEWILSPYREVTSHKYHKATLEELIEHFKK